jgi:hypothetical protein
VQVHALCSLSCGATGSRKAVARCGQQPAHRDAPAISRGGVRQELSDTLADAEMPLSAMIAVQEDTALWIFPGGCDERRANEAYLVELEVGDVLSGVAMLCMRVQVTPTCTSGCMPTSTRPLTSTSGPLVDDY